jgi:hypothetical protein
MPEAVGVGPRFDPLRKLVVFDELVKSRTMLLGGFKKVH